MITILRLYALLISSGAVLCGVGFLASAKILWPHNRELFGALRILSLAFGYCGISLIVGAVTLIYTNFTAQSNITTGQWLLNAAFAYAVVPQFSMAAVFVQAVAVRHGRLGRKRTAA
jgi:hypothetical protein